MSSSNDAALRSNQLPISIEIPSKERDFKDFLSNHLRWISDVVNTKMGGLFSIEEIFSFNQYFTENNPNIFRNVYRKCFDLVQLNGGNIAGGATVSFPHGISGITEATRIFAGCTSITPTYFSVMGQPTIYLDATNVNFTNPLGIALTSVNVVAEYLKN